MIQRDDMFSKETCDKGIQCILKLKKDSFQISGRSLIFCKMKITANLFIVWIQNSQFSKIDGNFLRLGLTRVDNYSWGSSDLDTDTFVTCLKLAICHSQLRHDQLWAMITGTLVGPEIVLWETVFTEICFWLGLIMWLCRIIALFQMDWLGRPVTTVLEMFLVCVRTL